ncbi:MAG: hypothetical protein AB7I59_22660 [Geminicoccaceae bacterium]
MRVEFRVWFDPGSRHIKLAGGGLISTVCDDQDSKRYHPNLYRKLAKLLRESGAPAPPAGNIGPNRNDDESATSLIEISIDRPTT